MLRIAVEKLTPHPLAISLIPEMAEVEYLALLESIRISGIKVPLDVIEKDDHYMVIDGVHRLRAAEELGLKKVPVNILVLTEEEIENHIISVQNARRNLTPAQKAVLALEWIERNGMGVSEAVKRFGVSKRAIEVARSVRGANPGVFSLMRKGLVSVSEAHSAKDVHDVRIIREEVKETMGDLVERVEALEEEKRLLEEKIRQQKASQEDVQRLASEVRGLKKEKEGLIRLVKKLHAIARMQQSERAGKPQKSAAAEELVSALGKAPTVDPVPPVRASETDTIADALSELLSMLRSGRVKKLLRSLQAADRISKHSLKKIQLLFDEMRGLISSISAFLARLALTDTTPQQGDTLLVFHRNNNEKDKAGDLDLQDEQGA